MDKGRTIIYVANSSWYLFNFRLSLMKRMKENGWRVVAVAPEDSYSERLAENGIFYIPLYVSRRGTNPLKDLILLSRLYRIYKTHSPSIVHHFTIKPIIYGSVAGRLAKVPELVNAITGLGFVFSSGGLKLRILKTGITFVYRIIFKRDGHKVVFQNPEDMESFINSGLVRPSDAVLIRGSGVNIERFVPSLKSDEETIILFSGRMLWDKGVGELIAAAKLLREWKVFARVVLAGESDPGNPTAIPEAQLHEWDQEGIITWLGHRDDIEKVLASSHIVALPTYYKEGLPKSLIEAAASGCPIVATDVPGCREIVRHGENGFLVPVHNVKALAEALRTLVENSSLRTSMGIRGREIVLAEFAEEHIINSTLKLYKELLDSVR